MPIENTHKITFDGDSHLILLDGKPTTITFTNITIRIGCTIIIPEVLRTVLRDYDKWKLASAPYIYQQAELPKHP